MKRAVILLTITLGMSQFAIFKLNSNYIRQANTIKATYIQPSLRSDQYTNMSERAILLRLDVLLTELVNGKHPAHRADKILMLSTAYVDTRKKRQKDIETLLNEIKLLTDQ